MSFEFNALRGDSCGERHTWDFTTIHLLILNALKIPTVSTHPQSWRLTERTEAPGTSHGVPNIPVSLCQPSLSNFDTPFLKAGRAVLADECHQVPRWDYGYSCEALARSLARSLGRKGGDVAHPHHRPCGRCFHLHLRQKFPISCHLPAGGAALSTDTFHGLLPATADKTPHPLSPFDSALSCKSSPSLAEQPLCFFPPRSPPPHLTPVTLRSSLGYHKASSHPHYLCETHP